MVSRPYTKKRRTSYFGYGKKKRRWRIITKKQKGKGWNNLIAQGFSHGLKKYLDKK